MKITNNIHTRLIVPFVLTLVVGTLSAWWIGTELLSRSLEERLTIQLDHAATVIAEKNFPFTFDLIQQLGKLLKANIILLQRSGRHGPSTLGDHQNTLYRDIEDLFKSWQAAQTTDAPFRFRSGHSPYLLKFHRIREGRDSRYIAVAILADLSDIQQASRHAAVLLGGFAIIGIILLAWVGHRIALSITRPVSELAEMANTISKGNRTARVQIYRHDEIGGLAKALNSMAGRLTHYEQQVAENSRLAAIGQMAARVAHEIRNPLTAIKMQVQLLAETLEQEQQNSALIVLDEIRRLELIVSSTLQLGRPAQLERHPAQLNQLINEIVKLQSTQFEHRGIHLSTVLEEDLPLLEVDADRIKQILLNLLINAGDELPNGGQIRISTTLLPDKVRIEVQDSGPGIPAEDREHLFSSSESKKKGGFGLGLQLSKELVELHHGYIDVGDSELGGARFTILLPLEK